MDRALRLNYVSEFKFATQQDAVKVRIVVHFQVGTCQYKREIENKCLVESRFFHWAKPLFWLHCILSQASYTSVYLLWMTISTSKSICSRQIANGIDEYLIFQGKWRFASCFPLKHREMNAYLWNEALVCWSSKGILECSCTILNKSPFSHRLSRDCRYLMSPKATDMFRKAAFQADELSVDMELWCSREKHKMCIRSRCVNILFITCSSSLFVLHSQNK